MLFYLKNGNDKLADREKGEGLDRIGVDTLETDSLVPRTNRGKLRRILISRYNVDPKYVKWAMKQLGWWSPERLGITDVQQRRLRYAQGIKT